AFMKTELAARRLARAMVAIGKGAGVRTRAVLSSMEQPLGRTVGNALEVAEAVDILRGRGPEDVTTLCLHETATLLTMAGLAANEHEGHARGGRAIHDGSGLAKLGGGVAAQGGGAAPIEETSPVPQAPYHEVVPAPRSGYITTLDTERMGMVSVHLGAGRLRKGDPIDYAVGLVLLAKVGDRLERGAPLVEVHARSPEQAAAIRDE